MEKEQRQMMIIWAIVVALLIVLILLSLLLGTGGVSEESKIDLGFDNNVQTDSSEMTIHYSDAAQDIEEVKELPVYELSTIDPKQNIVNFITKNNLVITNETQGETISRWIMDQNVITLNYTTGRFSFYFEPALQVELLTDISDDGYKNLCRDIVSDQLELTISLNSLLVERGADTVTVSYTPEQNSYKLFTNNVKGYHSYIVFDFSGGVKSGEISFVTFGDTYKEYSLESFDDIKYSIGQGSYPKASYVKDSVFLSGESIPLLEGGEGLIGSQIYDEDLLFAQDCIASNVELGYYYNSTADEYLTPVYRFECKGNVEYQNGIYEITEVIIATALDLKYIK